MPRFGAHDPGMVVGERAALIGVEFGRQTPAAQRFLKGLEEGLGVGPQEIRRIDNEPRMVVNDDTQKRGNGWPPSAGCR